MGEAEGRRPPSSPRIARSSRRFASTQGGTNARSRPAGACPGDSSRGVETMRGAARGLAEHCRAVFHEELAAPAASPARLRTLHRIETGRPPVRTPRVHGRRSQLVAGRGVRLAVTERVNPTSGATWPDVGLAVVEFAREDTWRFLAVLVVFGIILWLLFPRITLKFKERYRAIRENAEHSPAGDEDSD